MSLVVALKRRIVLKAGITFLALAGCAATHEPTPELRAATESARTSASQAESVLPPEPNAELSTVISAQRAYDAAPVFLMRAGEHQFAMFAIDGNGRLRRDGGYSEKLLLFEDERYLGTIPESDAFKYESCLAQIDGAQMLATRLRSIAAGEFDPLSVPHSDRGAPVGQVQCPSGFDGPAKERAGNGQGGRLPGEFATGAAETLFYSAGVILSPIILPLAAIAGGTGMFSAEGSNRQKRAVHAGEDEQILAAQRQISVRTTRAELDSLMRTPTLRLLLQPANTEVRYYRRKRLLPLWVGLQDDQVVWLRFGSHSSAEWLERAVQAKFGEN